MRSFQKIFSKNLYLYCASNLGTLQGFNQTLSILLGFSKNVSDEHAYITSSLKVPPRDFGFHPRKKSEEILGFSLKHKVFFKFSK